MSNNYSLTEHFVPRQILDELILVPVSPAARQKNEMLVLNQSAAFFLEQIRAGQSVAEIERLALECFEGLSAEGFRRDFSAFLKEMEKLEAIRGTAASG